MLDRAIFISRVNSGAIATGHMALTNSTAAALPLTHQAHRWGRRWQQRPHGPAGRMHRFLTGSGCNVAAVSSPERLTVTERSPPPPPAEVEIRVIGFGSRGANAVSKLVKHGKVGWLNLVEAAR